MFNKISNYKKIIYKYGIDYIGIEFVCWVFCYYLCMFSSPGNRKKSNICTKFVFSISQYVFFCLFSFSWDIDVIFFFALELLEAEEKNILINMLNILIIVIYDFDWYILIIVIYDIESCRCYILIPVYVCTAMNICQVTN